MTEKKIKEKRETRRKSRDRKFEAKGSSTDGMLFCANVVNNERYRYVIPSFKDDEKSSHAVHKLYNGYYSLLPKGDST